MTELEVKKLFLVIQNIYASFQHDEVKINLWHDLLQDTPFELAQSNLRRFIMDPDNKFPPHPGVLSETPTQRVDGPYVPGIAETRKLLQQMDEFARMASPIPDHVREEMKALAARNGSAS